MSSASAASPRGSLNGTTAVVMVPASQDNQAHIIDTGTIYNADTTGQTVTVLLGTLPIKSAYLNPGESLDLTGPFNVTRDNLSAKIGGAPTTTQPTFSFHYRITPN